MYLIDVHRRIEYSADAVGNLPCLADSFYFFFCLSFLMSLPCCGCSGFVFSPSVKCWSLIHSVPLILCLGQTQHGHGLSQLQM
jgi:hypothetical protein